MFVPFQTSASADLESEVVVVDHNRTCFETVVLERIPCTRLKTFCHRSTVSLKIVIHVLLLIAVTSQLLVDNNESDYLRSARRSWFRFFLPPEYEEAEDFSPTRPHYLYTSEDVVNAVRHCLVGYETIVEESLDTLAYFPPGAESNTEGNEKGGIIVSPESLAHGRGQPMLKVTQYTSPSVFDPDKQFDSSTETIEVPVNSSFLGPLEDAANRKAFLKRVVQMVLSFRMVSIEMVSLRRACLIWQIDLIFSFRGRGQMKETLGDWIVRDCDDITSSEELFDPEDLLWLNLVLIVLSLIYLFAIVRHVTRKVNDAWREDQGNGGSVYEDTTEVRVRIFFISILRRICAFCDFWVVSDIVALSCIILSSLVNIVNNAARRPTAEFHMATIGLGNGLLWINLVQYFSHNRTYFALILTLERSVPKVAKFLMGVAPIFMGYAVFGVSFFGAQTVRFSTLFNSYVTLFSLLNGDAVSETFHELIPISAFVAQIYLYSFILLWTYVVLNILIAIVEESFFTSLWSTGGSHQQGGDKSPAMQPSIDRRWFRTTRIPTYLSGSSNDDRQKMAGHNGTSGANALGSDSVGDMMDGQEMNNVVLPSTPLEPPAVSFSPLLGGDRSNNNRVTHI